MADCTSKRRSSRRAWAAAGALALLAGAVSGAGNNSATAKVTAVRFWSLGEVTRISIEVSSDFKYRHDRLSDPDRLFFDIEGARPAFPERTMHTIAVGDALVKQIRVAETQPGVTRVVLDLEPHTPPASFTASQLADPNRLMVEVRLKDKPAPPLTGSVSGAERLRDAPLSALSADLAAPPPASALTKPASTNLALSVAAASASVAAPAKPAARPFRAPADPPARLPVLSRDIPVAPALPSQPSRLPQALARLAPPSLLNPAGAPGNSPVPDTPGSVTPRASSEETPLPARTRGSAAPSLTRALGLKLGRVVIDAGHGGNDAGTRGPSGLLEKNVTLDVALRLGKLLQDRLGTEVVYTRTDDTYVALQERTQIANDHKADLFLSIHANSSPYRVVAGVETYYLNFTTSKTAMDLAARENAGSQSSIFDLKDMLEKIAMKDKIDESRTFALSVQNAMAALAEKNNAAAKNRGVKKAPFVVLIGASMPSVLAEIGFLTNSSDEALLRRPEQRQRIAEALYKGISAYADSLSHFQVAKRE